jgi:signal transduction histidine kinase
MSKSENAEFFSDPGRINILFMNLISNSIKYQSPDLTNPFVKIEIIVEGNQAEIVISDNSIGIEEEFHAKIFEMFFRASESSFGSGLGLYIVKQVVDKLQGTIKIDSKPGKGSIFKAVLPSLGTRSIPFMKQND